MKPSTVLELAGFAALTAAAWRFGAVPGLIVSGLVLLFLGYAFEDETALIAIRKYVVQPMRDRRARSKSRRQERNAAKVKAGSDAPRTSTA